MAVRIGIVTATQLPQADPDQPGLLAALAALGAETHVLSWDDDDAPWASLDIAVVRSTWNYVTQRDRFLAWAERAASVTLLLNPPEVLRTNTDKIYLRELEARGVAIVPTVFAECASDAGAALAEIQRRRWDDVVIKPRISAGSLNTERFVDAGRSPAALRDFLAAQLAARDMMIQPYQASVDDWGERSLIWIDGEFTHAVRKSPRFAGQPFVLSGALPIAADEGALATRALEPLVASLLYARVDLVRDEKNAPQVMEIELTEPFLMLDRSRDALERFARAIVRRAGQGRPG